MIRSCRILWERLTSKKGKLRIARLRSASCLQYKPWCEPFEDRLALNYSFGAAAYQPINLVAGAPGVFTIINYADDLAAPINLGTNTFNFFGTTYTGFNQLFASSNALVTFEFGNSNAVNTDLTSLPQEAAIAPMWTDWIKTSGGPMLLGQFDSGNNRLILQWDKLDSVNSPTTPIPATFQLILQLNSGNTPGTITFNYASVDTGNADANGATSTIGIKNRGTQGPDRILVSFNSTNPLIGNNQAIQITWDNPVPVITGLSATSAVEGSSPVPLTVTGSNFSTSSVVQVNGASLATTFGNASQLQVTLPALVLAEEGNLNITVLNPGNHVSNSEVFTVADASLAATHQSINATEGLPFTGVVATFTDANPNSTTADFSATITWGDGHTSNGTVAVNPTGGFTVTGSNTYLDEGSYSLTVHIVDDGGAVTDISGTAVVADASLTAAGSAITATEGAGFNGVVATFTDANPNSTTADFSATITWGDGHTSNGTVAVNPTGGFTVTGSNTYLDEGSYSPTVHIVDDGGAVADISGTAVVADASLTATGSAITATEGAGFNGVVATFTDANPNSTAADFSATIIWGDGHTSNGTVAVNPTGGFTVTGSNTYLDEGSYSPTVQIADDGGAVANVTSPAVVADASLTAKGSAITATEGAGFNGVVATFTDTNPNSTTADFSATITWGDGQTSSGIVAANPNGGFNVLGTNTYHLQGSYAITVQIHDVGGTSTTAASMAQIADGPLTATGSTFNVTTGVAFSNVVATFTDSNPFGQAGDFTAAIAWGDSTRSMGTVVANANGGFSVLGNHSYGKRGSYSLTIAILDKGGSSATASSTVLVSHSKPVVKATVRPATTSWETAILSGSFSDLVSQHHVLLVNWGDGKVTTLDLHTGTGGLFSLRHHYAGSFIRRHPQGVNIVVKFLLDDGTFSDPLVLHSSFFHHRYHLHQ